VPRRRIVTLDTGERDRPRDGLCPSDHFAVTTTRVLERG